MGETSFFANLGIALFAALVASVIVGACQSALWPRFHRYQASLSPKQYSRAIFGYALVPFAVGLALFVSCAAVPTAAGFNIVPAHCHYEAAVEYCVPHAPMTVTPSVLSSFLGVLALFLVPVVGLFGRRMQAHGRLFRELQRNSSYNYDLDAWVLRSDGVLAFCVGIFRRQIFVSEGLLNNMDADEVQIVLYHERGHARRADALTLFALHLLTLPFFPKACRGLEAEFLLSVEHECDRHAANECGDSLAVADALVRLSRIRLQKQACEPQLMEMSAFSALGQSLERRIVWLVQSPLPMGGGRMMIFERLICYAVIVAFIIAEPVHQALEHILKFAFG